MADDPKEQPARPFFKALVYERDGSLNLSWVILLIYTILSVVAVGFAMFSRHPLAFIAVLSFLAVTINLFALGAFSQNKATIVAQARNIGEAGRAVAGIGGKALFGPTTQEFDDIPFDYERDRDKPRLDPPEVG